MKNLTLAALCLALFAIGAVSTNAQTPQTFSNTTPINITDAGTGNPYPSIINVTGLNGTITDVNVRLNGVTHTFPDDIDILLVSPSNKALIIQSDAGGGIAVTNRTYTLDQQAPTQIPTGSLPAEGASASPGNHQGNDGTNDLFPAPAPAGPYLNPGPQTGGTAGNLSSFNGDPPNGQWRLFVTDDEALDTGSISGGWALIITTTGGPGTTDDAVVDFNGDGRTDYAVVRNGAANTSATWFIAESGAAAGGLGATRAQPFGLSPVVSRFASATSTSDITVPADYDGDDRDDIAVWRPTNGVYYIFRSSTNTLEVFNLGRQGDEPTVVDDYDGDDRDDPAVYRRGSATTVTNPGCGNTLGVSAWYYRQSAATGPILYRCWGSTTDVPSPGDYDGDGRADFNVQRDAAAGGTGQATFFLLRSTGQTEVIPFGQGNDLIVPGDYDGDGRTDIATVRVVGSVYNWFIRPSGAAATTRVEQFGNSTDVTVQGDYNGDGRTDLAVWRSNADPTQNFFFIRTSPTTAGGAQTSFAVEWGQQGDVPAANYNTH